ncbi:unnamed protein product [Symbiodinium natans]|uniref:non-specific serine/threonine protein kinase n=1 Tax=Symbiodinium natans TaxID=878477 RepID=A0A812RD02_9DINO|nr:unnamed protein product [Symbiodinium natans]
MFAWCAALRAKLHDVDGLQVREVAKIGEGGFSCIWRVDLISDRGPADEHLPRTMALKKTICQDEERLDFARSEVAVLRQAAEEGRGRPGQEFLVRFFSYQELSGQGRGGAEVQLLMEWCDAGCLLDRILHGERETTMRCPNMAEADIKNIVREVAAGLAFLHSLGVVHYDLKPENILFHGRHVRLCDFGSANSRQWPDFGKDTPRHVVREVELFFTQRTTPMFRPPELADPDLVRFPITSQVDLFMLGLCLFQMLFRVHAFPMDGKLANINARYSCPASARSVYSKSQMATLDALLQRDPRERPTAQELAVTGCLQSSAEA